MMIVWNTEVLPAPNYYYFERIASSHCDKCCQCFSEVLFKDGVVLLLYQDMQYVHSVQLKYLHV